MRQQNFFQALFIGAICRFLLISANSLAGGKIDFSGAWTLNEEQSEIGESRFLSAVKLSIEHKEGAMKIDRTRTGREGQERVMNETVNLDGTKSANESERATTSSVASWSEDGKSLTIEYDIEFNRQGETINMKRTEVWTLDKKGKTLTIQLDSTSPRGEISMTLVYDKD